MQFPPLKAGQRHTLPRPCGSADGVPTGEDSVGVPMGELSTWAAADNAKPSAGKTEERASSFM